jgi:hypothetical protein
LREWGDTPVIALDAEHAGADNNRGDACDAKGDDDRAIADCNQAVALKFSTRRPLG